MLSQVVLEIVLFTNSRHFFWKDVFSRTLPRHGLKCQGIDANQLREQAGKHSVLANPEGALDSLSQLQWKKNDPLIMGQITQFPGQHKNVPLNHDIWEEENHSMCPVV